jgi:DNA repair photolyase
MDGERSTPMSLRSRYVMKQGEPLVDLERHLQRLSARGELRRATVVFGVTTDPFHPFDEKFATSMKFLELFERYVPGRLVIQTRSPLVVIGLPMLKKVRETTYVSIGIETPLEEVARRYTPDLPTVEERWKTVRALRRFGLKVGVQVAPILPYGDWRKDAPAFAQRLCAEGDYVTVRSILQTCGVPRPTTPLARKLASDRQFFWLRQDSQNPLLDAVIEHDAKKLYHPAGLLPVDPQLRLFAKA